VIAVSSSPANDVQWATGIGLLCWWSTVHPASTNDGQRAAEIISLYFGDEQLSHSRRAMPFNPRDHRYSQSQSMMMTSRENGAVVSFVNGLTDGTVTGPVKPLFQEITKDVYRTEAKIVDMVTQAYAKFLNHINFCSLKNHYYAKSVLKAWWSTPRIFRFIDGIFCQYLHYHFIGKKITDKITDKKSPSVNFSLVIFYPSLSPLVIKKYYYRWIYWWKNQAKKIYFIPSVISSETNCM